MQAGKGFRHPLPPPFALQPAYFRNRKARSKRKPRRGAEGTAERSADRLAAHVGAKIACHVRIEVADRTARFEPRPGGVEKDRLDHRATVSVKRPPHDDEAAHQRPQAPPNKRPSVPDLAAINAKRLAGQRQHWDIKETPAARP